MSTSPSTEDFVTGDRVTYKFYDSLYPGTVKHAHPRLKGWYVVQLDGHGESTLVGYDLTKLDAGPSLEDFKAHLSELSSNLESKLKDVSDGMEDHFEWDEYHFDAGFTAGLRVALNEIAKLSESL